VFTIIAWLMLWSACGTTAAILMRDLRPDLFSSRLYTRNDFAPLVGVGLIWPITLPLVLAARNMSGHK